MRIFFVTNNYIPYSGGVVQSINAITDELRAQGHEVFIITLDFLGDTAKITDPDYVIRISCPIKFRYKKNYMAIPWRPTHAIDLLAQKYKPDIIHVHHPFLLGTSALHIVNRYSIPCVFTYHTIYEEYAHYIPIAQTLARPIIQKLVLHFCNAVDAIIAPSTFIKQYLQSHNVTTPITVIPSPLRKIFYNFSPFHAHKKVHMQFFELLLVTRFVPEKNIPFVFEVMKLLPDTFHLTLVGYGADYEKIKKQAFDTFHFSPQRITFIHQPSQDNLLTLYRSADLFIFPSTTDTQAIVLAESMSQGIPVIALDGPGQRDIISNGKNGFIIENAQQAAERIMQTFQDNALHNRLKEGACITAQRYHADVIVQQLIAIYQLHKK